MTIDGTVVVEMWTSGPMRESTGTVTLSAGWHAIFVEWFQGGGPYGFHVNFEGAGMSKSLLGAKSLEVPFFDN